MTMEIQLDSQASEQFYSCKCRYQESMSDSQFLAVLVAHFEKCSKNRESIDSSIHEDENFNNCVLPLDSNRPFSVSEDDRQMPMDLKTGLYYKTSELAPPYSTGNNNQSNKKKDDDKLSRHEDDVIVTDTLDSVRENASQESQFSSQPSDWNSATLQEEWYSPESEQNISCPICSTETFNSREAYNKHMASHVTSSLPVFPCELCGDKFASNTALLSHLFSEHPEESQLVQDQDSKSLELINHSTETEEEPMDQDDIEKDEIECKRETCHSCSKSFENVSTLHEHLKECSNLSASSPQPPNLMSSSRDKSGSEDDLNNGSSFKEEHYRCACGMKFTWAEQFACHRVSCSIATGQDFMQMEKEMMAEESVNLSLPQQFLQFSPALRSPQTSLSSSFKTESLSSDTVNSHPGCNSALDLSVKAAETILANSIKTACPECKFMAPTLDALFDHFDGEHQAEGTFPCPCGSMFEQLPQFLRHYITCPVTTPDFQESLGQAQLAAAHILAAQQQEAARNLMRFNVQQSGCDPSVAVGKLLIACPRCGQQFTQQHEMIRHLSHCQHHHFQGNGSQSGGKPSQDLRVRTPTSSIDNLMPPPSGNTQQAQQQRGSVSNHQNNANTSVTAAGEQPRPFKCSYCIKSFKSKALLDQHMHIHYPPKYTCRFCGKKYRWPPVFYHHQRTCKKRPPPPSSLTSSQSVTTTTLSQGHHQQPMGHSPPLKMHQNGFTSTSLPPPPLGIKAHNGTTGGSMPGSLQFGGGSLSCLCGFKFDDLSSYVSHVNSCQVLMSRLGPRQPHPLAAMLPPHLLAASAHHSPVATQHHSLLSVQQSPHHQATQNTAAMMAAVAAAMSQQNPNHHASLMMKRESFTSPVNTPTSGNNKSAGLLSSNQPPSLPDSPRMDSPSPLGGLSFKRNNSNDNGSGCNLCSQCGKEFSSRLSLKQHVEGKHSAEGKYLCPGCGKRYRWGASYYYHKKSCPAAKDIPEPNIKSPPGLPLAPGMVLPPVLMHPWERDSHRMSPPLMNSNQLQAQLQALATSCTK